MQINKLAKYVYNKHCCFLKWGNKKVFFVRDREENIEIANKKGYKNL